MNDNFILFVLDENNDKNENKNKSMKNSYINVDYKITIAM